MSMIVKSGFRYANSIPDAFLIPAVDSDGRSSSVQTELNKLYGAIAIKDFNVAANHNGIYRGATLVDTVDGAGRYTLSELYAMVSQGDFSDIYIGDIIKVSQAAVTYTPAGGSAVTDAAQTVEWIVMGIDTYLGTGDTELTAHHLVLVPKDTFTTPAHMNSTNTTKGGYIASDMYTNILPSYETAIKSSLGSHVLTYRSTISSAMSENIPSPGYGGYQGAASAWQWKDVTVNLLSPSEVFGKGGNIYDTGEKNSQLPGFFLNPSLKIKRNVNWDQEGTSRIPVWLSGVGSTVNFYHVSAFGTFSFSYASSAYGVAPKVLFG